MTETSAGEAAGRCLTPCDPDCDADCHEEHDVPAKREHRPEECPARVSKALNEAQLAELQSKLGRWVEPYDIMRTTFAWDLLAEVIRERDEARTELAELRERIGTERVVWGYGRTAKGVTPASSATHAGDVARHRGEKRWTRIEGEWKAADDGQ